MSGDTQGQDAPVIDNEASELPAAAPIADSSETGTQADNGAEKETAVERTYTQKEFQESIEKATAKAAAKAERRAYREALESIGRAPQQAAPENRENDGRPNRAQYGDDDQYQEAMIDWKLEKRDRASNQQRAEIEQQSLSKKTEGMYAEAAKQPGFDRDAFNDLPLTKTIAQAVTESDIAPKLMVYMAQNPDDVERIAKLSPIKQAAEIGKLEVRLATASPSRVASPITPIGSRGVTNPSLDSASMEDYAKLRAKQGAPWARNRN